MDEMDTTGPARTPLQISAQRRFFQWAVKWFYTQTIEDTSKKPDVPSLVILLKAVGFQLREFEKEEVSNEDVVPKESIQVTIKCGSSQMKAVLEMDGIDCQCPSNNEAKEGSLWSICGTGPTPNDSINNSKYEESGSNLLPTIPKGVNSVVRDVVYRLFKIVNNPNPLASANSGNDLNVSALGSGDVVTTPLKKSESKETFFRSRTQPTIPSVSTRSSSKKPLTTKNLLRRASDANDGKISEMAKLESEIQGGSFLQRERTWHMDVEIDSLSDENSQKATTSSRSSNTMDKLCDSLDQISVGTEGYTLELVDFIMKAYRNLEKAVRIVTKKSPVTSSTLSLNNEFFNNPPPLIPRSSASSSPMTMSRPGSAASTVSRASLKLPVRRSVASISRKSTEKAPTTAGGETSTTPLRRKSFHITSASPKTIPPKLTIPTRVQNNSNSSMNSTTLSDKTILSAKKGVSPNLRSSPLIVKRNNFGPNTSLKGQTTILNNARPTSVTSNGTPGSTKFGFSRNK